MDYVNYVLLALVAFLLIQRFLPTKGVKQMTTSDLKKELNDKDKQYIDVRTPGEFRTNNIRGFNNIPLHQLADKAGQLSKEKETVVICQSGMRSNKASKILKKQGFKHVTNVKGGMMNWTGKVV